MIAATSLIPKYDMLGLPLPAWIFQVLMALTLALHWSFLAATAGGTIALLLGKRGPDRQVSPLLRRLAPALPLCLSLAMTIGIAPLLFVQVLYGNLFYTANILAGFAWLGLLGIVILAFYLLYFAWRRVTTGKMPGKLTAALTLAALAAAGLVLAANATLTQHPDAWDAMRAKGGGAPYMGDTTLGPRLGVAFSALVAGGGLFVAAFARIRLRADAEAAGRAARGGLDLAVLGILALFACGLWATLALPADQRAALLHSGESAFAHAATAAFILAAVLALRARRAKTFSATVLPGLAFFVGLFAVAGLRDTLRRLALADHFSLADLTVKQAQWDSFGLFLGAFVIGLGVIAYLVKLALRKDGAPAPAEQP